MQVPVSAIHIHPNWTIGGDRYDFDAALLRLSTPLNLSNNTKAIQMNSRETILSAGIEIRVTGWGATPQGGPGSKDLLFGEMPVVSNRVCNEPQYFNGTIPSDMFCAGRHHGGKDSCQGDSGGPVDTLIRGEDVLVGLVSWRHGCAQGLRYGVYTRVSMISDWASSTMAGY